MRIAKLSHKIYKAWNRMTDMRTDFELSKMYFFKNADLLLSISYQKSSELIFANATDPSAMRIFKPYLFLGNGEMARTPNLFAVFTQINGTKLNLIIQL